MERWHRKRKAVIIRQVSKLHNHNVLLNESFMRERSEDGSIFGMFKGAASLLAACSL